MRSSCPVGRRLRSHFFANEEMDRVENYDTMDLAVFRADEIKRWRCSKRIGRKTELLQLLASDIAPSA